MFTGPRPGTAEKGICKTADNGRKHHPDAPANHRHGFLAPEVRAELQALAQGARETISRAWSLHTHGPTPGHGDGSKSGLRTSAANPCRRCQRPSCSTCRTSRSSAGHHIHHPDCSLRPLSSPPGCRSRERRKPHGPRGRQGLPQRHRA